MPNDSYSNLAFDQALSDVDPFMADLIDHELRRQHNKLVLIPSESITPAPVRAALGSPLTSLYAEGYPAGPMTRDTPERLANIEWQLARYRRYGDRRYYRGNEFTNLIESLAQQRCAALFANDIAPADRIRVNVQALSGAAANNAVYEALLEPHDTILGLNLAHGGHLSHGASVNRSGRRFKTASYEISSVDARLDYDEIATIARREQPRIIVAGYTSYPWAPDWDRFRTIADEVGAYLLADISHPAGLVVAGEYPSPVGIADIVTFTTHKTLFGPRAAVILSHKQNIMRRIDRSVFPGEQGGPHLNKIGAMAVAFALASTEAFRTTQRQITANALALATSLQAEDISLAYGGTDTHLLVIDLKRSGASGDLRAEPAVRILDALGIVTNRNSLPGDIGFAAPTGVRVGTPWLTQRGFGVSDMETVAGILGRAFRAMTGITYPGRKTARFRGRIDFSSLNQLKADVTAMAKRGLSEQTPPASNEEPETILELQGRRVLAFADEISNQRVRDLQPGGAMHVGVSGPDATVHSVLFIRPNEKCLPRDRRLYAVTDPEKVVEMAAWLQAIADGYVLLDRNEPSRKIVGPIAVINSSHQGARTSGMVLDAASASSLGSTGTTQVTLDGVDLLIAIDGPAAVALYDTNRAQEAQAALSNHGSEQTALPPPPDPDLHLPFFLGRSEVLPTTPPRKVPSFVWTNTRETNALLETPLHAVHRDQCNARMVPFAGWDMPVYYKSGIEKEHAAVRQTAGLFDVGHMGIFAVEGNQASEFLDLVTTANASRLAVGRSAYTYLLDATGHTLDDLIIYRLAATQYLAVVNASNADKDWSWLTGVNEQRHEIERDDPWAASPVKVVLRDLKQEAEGDRRRIDLALQGPKARNVLHRLSVDPDTSQTIQRMRPFDVRSVTLANIDLELAYTGYTGEKIGYELFVHPEAAVDLWNNILQAGDDIGVIPAGLAARDSTRTEAGLPLYGHELGGSLDLSPGDAGFGSFIKMYKTFFVGRSGLIERERSRTSQIVRFAITDTHTPMARQGDPVVDTRGSWVGSVTSAARDLAQQQVGMAHVTKQSSAEGSNLYIYAGASARRATEPIAPQDLCAGTRSPLPISATVISRFPTASPSDLRTQSKTSIDLEHGESVNVTAV